jgi:3-phosphoshikimate 1-carboxyvinyltransferase
MPSLAITPRTGAIEATVAVPGSKSVANRALICAALAEGESLLVGLPGGDDTAAMLDCLELLGVAVRDVAGTDEDDPDGRVRGLSILGTGGRLPVGPITLPTRLAGTTSRFITALAGVGPGPYVVDGLPPLRARPMAPLHDALVELGVGVRNLGEWGHLPVEICGPLTAPDAQVAVRGDISSQYITALMLIGPHLPDGLRITLTTELVSRPYVTITQAVMKAFGVATVHVGHDTIDVGPGRYAPRTYTVEPDASSASYPLAAAAICGGSVQVPGLGTDSLQGDAGFAGLLERMGCVVHQTATSTKVSRRGALHGIDVDMVDLSDLVPTLAVVAAFTDGPTRIRGVGFIRGKESDRLGDLCAELRRAGIDASETEDGLSIRPGEVHGATLQTHHDHRLAMAFGLLGLRVPGVEIADPQVVSKSWPDYWTMLEGLR